MQNLKADQLPDRSNEEKVAVSKHSERVIMPRDQSNHSIPDETDYVEVWKVTLVSMVYCYYIDV